MITEFEIWWELPKCDIETWNEQILLGNGTNKFAQHAMNLQFVKRKTPSAKLSLLNLVGKSQCENFSPGSVSQKQLEAVN